MYNAKLDRPDIKMATQISKIISNVISLSYLEQKMISYFWQETKHGFGSWIVNLMNKINQSGLMTSQFFSELLI